jgi:hypothetical protein
MVDSNTHVHSPYSFSFFDSIRQTVLFAKEEQITALGINDFNTFDGFSEFEDICKEFGIYPLFNIEFITLSQEDKRKKLRWNDPSNPGIMYLCGKGLDKIPVLSRNTRNLMASIWKGTQDRIWKMIDLLNVYMHEQKIDISLNYNQIRNEYAKNSVRERHVAKALYLAFVEKWNDPITLNAAFKRLFNDTVFSVDLSDSVNMQNEIRKQLLKTGKIAYVEEKPNAFMEFSEAKALILEAGGIPCYPMLLEDLDNITENEKDISSLYSKLIEMGIHAVEFISNRIQFEVLKKYAKFFRKKGFCVTFGTEHNTAERFSLIPCAKGGCPFDKELESIAHDGTCTIAAHQQLHKQNRPGFVDEQGSKIVSQNQLREFIKIGDEAIKRITPIYCIN